MKKINFLIKLNREGKLKVVEPNENLKESYINKSKSSLKSAKILIDNDQIEDAVPMAYYSMYNMLTALLYNTGIKCENHSGSILLLKELFGINNSKISFAKTERVDKQYYVNFKISKQEVVNLMKTAEEFNSTIFDFIDKMTSIQAERYKEQLEDSLQAE